MAYAAWKAQTHFVNPVRGALTMQSPRESLSALLDFLHKSKVELGPPQVILTNPDPRRSKVRVTSRTQDKFDQFNLAGYAQDVDMAAGPVYLKGLQGNLAYITRTPFDVIPLTTDVKNISLRRPLQFDFWNQLNVITINGHGKMLPPSNPKTPSFLLPWNVYVLVPHHAGLEASYTFPNSQARGGYERFMYLPGPPFFHRLNFNYGWKLYKAGEFMPNQGYSPFSIEDKAGPINGATCSQMADPSRGFAMWQQKLVASCIAEHRSWCPLLVPDEQKDATTGQSYGPMKIPTQPKPYSMANERKSYP